MDIETDPKLITNTDLKLSYELSGAAPVQAFGNVDGKELYFRARHNEWSLDIANTDGKLPSDGFDGGYFRSGKFKNASYMPYTQAEVIINDCVQEYLRSKNT